MIYNNEYMTQRSFFYCV